MSVVDRIQSMVATLTDTLDDAAKADRGQKAAATRVRKALSTVGKECTEVRKAALEATKVSDA